MKFNQILQAYDMRVSSDKTKAVALEGRHVRGVKTGVNRNIYNTAGKLI
jgi:hypothetical protein